MSTLTLEASPVLPMVLLREPSAVRESQIRVSVQLALASYSPQPRRVERRHSERDPFPHPVHITPLSADHRPLVDQTVIVIGRNLSEQGFDFYHHEPLPFRRAIVSLPTDGNEWVSFLFELFWTRYNCHGWYDNGGRFLAVVPSPDLAA